MNLSAILGVLYIAFFPFLSTAQQTTNYFDLVDLSIENTDSNQLYFFCRKSNNEFTSKGANIWKESILLTTTRDTFAVFARINPLKDEIEIRLNNAPCILFKEKTEAIAIGNQVYFVSQYPKKGQLFLTYFELISEGRTALLFKENEDTFYYKKQDQPARKIKRSKKGVCNIFKDRRKEVEEFMTNKKLNPKNNQDLIQLFFFMNE